MEATPFTRRVFLLAFVAWTLIGLLSVSQQWLQAHTEQAPPLAWRRLARLFEDVWLWAAYTPLILWLAERFPVEARTWMRRLPCHCGFAFGFAVLDAVALSATAPVLGLSPRLGLVGAFSHMVTLSVLSYFAVLGLGHALRYHRLNAKGRLHASELERQLAQARLGALEAQLRPHFLFNALHAVASLVRAGDARAAIRTIAGLGEILRAALRDGGDQEIRLSDELRLAERYLEIERARFEDRLTVRIEADAPVGDALVPRFVLQPLLENAVRHGIERRTGGGTILLRAWRAGDALHVEVVDSGSGATRPLGAGTGVGLANTRARIRHLYGSEAHLDLEAAPGGETVARIVVPYRPAVSRLSA